MKSPDSSTRGKLLQCFLDHQGQLREYVGARIPPRLRGEVDAEDIVQEVCARLLEAASGFTDLGEAARVSWLLHIAKNVTLDALRRANTRVRRASGPRPREGAGESPEGDCVSHLPAPGKTPSGELHSTETCEMVLQTLHSLGMRAGRIIRMYYIDSLPINHIAAKFHVAPSTIRRVLRRAVRTMEVALGDGWKFKSNW